MHGRTRYDARHDVLSRANRNDDGINGGDRIEVRTHGKTSAPCAVYRRTIRASGCEADGGGELDPRPTTSSAYIATTYRRRQGPCCVGTIPNKIDGWPFYRHPRGENVRATAEKSEKILRYPAAAGGVVPVLPRSFASSTAATLAVWRKTADRQTLPTTRIRNSAPRCGSRCPPPSGQPDRNLSATAPGRSLCPASCRESSGNTRAVCRRETNGCR